MRTYGKIFFFDLFNAVDYIKSSHESEYFSPIVLFSFMRAKHVLSYHLIQVPWFTRNFSLGLKLFPLAEHGKISKNKCFLYKVIFCHKIEGIRCFAFHNSFNNATYVEIGMFKNLIKKLTEVFQVKVVLNFFLHTFTFLHALVKGSVILRIIFYPKNLP